MTHLNEEELTIPDPLGDMFTEMGHTVVAHTPVSEIRTILNQALLVAYEPREYQEELLDALEKELANSIKQAIGTPTLQDLIDVTPEEYQGAVKAIRWYEERIKQWET